MSQTVPTEAVPLRCPSADRASAHGEHSRNRADSNRACPERWGSLRSQPQGVGRDQSEPVHTQNVLGQPELQQTVSQKRENETKKRNKNNTQTEVYELSGISHLKFTDLWESQASLVTKRNFVSKNKTSKTKSEPQPRPLLRRTLTHPSWDRLGLPHSEERQLQHFHQAAYLVLTCDKG